MDLLSLFLLLFFILGDNNTLDSLRLSLLLFMHLRIEPNILPQKSSQHAKPCDQIFACITCASFQKDNNRKSDLEERYAIIIDCDLLKGYNNRFINFLCNSCKIINKVFSLKKKEYHMYMSGKFIYLIERLRFSWYAPVAIRYSYILHPLELVQSIMPFFRNSSFLLTTYVA